MDFPRDLGVLGGLAVQEVLGDPLGLLRRPDLMAPERQDHLYRLLLQRAPEVPEALRALETNRNHSMQASSPKSRRIILFA
jgi:hypothetical protein